MYTKIFYWICIPACREVVSGSKLSAQKSEKWAYFEPISEPQFDEKIGIFFKKMWYFPHSQTAIPLKEPADPRGSRSYRRIVDSGWEKCHFFWKKSQILFEFDSFFAVESRTFFAENSAQFLRTHRCPQIFCGLFRKRKLPHFWAQKTWDRIWYSKLGYFWENVAFSSFGDCNSPFGAATLGILVSLYIRITIPWIETNWSHFFHKKSPVSLLKFNWFFGGLESGNFSPFLDYSAWTLRRPP